MKNNKIEFKKLTRFSLEEFVDMFTNTKQKVSKRKKFWLYLIRNKKLTCKVSKLTVSYCSYDYDKYAKSYHYNFYSEDGTLFTIDHIIPKAKGGADNTSNIQPMIAVENFKKGNNYEKSI